MDLEDENMSNQDENSQRDSGAQKVPQLSVKRADSDRYNATYSFLNEDHTLGNLLRN